MAIATPVEDLDDDRAPVSRLVFDPRTADRRRASALTDEELAAEPAVEEYIARMAGVQVTLLDRFYQDIQHALDSWIRVRTATPQGAARVVRNVAERYRDALNPRAVPTPRLTRAEFADRRELPGSDRRIAREAQR
jgi:hypothetical protein